MDLDSSLVIATHFGLEGPGIESRYGWDFPHWDPPNLLYNGYRVNFSGVKQTGRGVDHPPLYRFEVKERVELYLYYLCGPS
jgi:hypothetical protein